jgi:hypothetical protein
LREYDEDKIEVLVTAFNEQKNHYACSWEFLNWEPKLFKIAD